MTTPFDFKTCRYLYKNRKINHKKHNFELNSPPRTIIPRWEEVIVFNEDFSHFTKDHPNVLIMFELLDTNKSHHEQTNFQTQSYTSQDTGKNWQRIAWAFLKLVGSDKSLNIEKKTRLQLYYSQSAYKFNLIESLVPEVYNLYKNGPRVKYPSSLHVTVKSILPPKSFLPGVGSSDLLANEYFESNQNIYSSSNKDMKDISKSQLSLHKIHEPQIEQDNNLKKKL